MKIKTITVGICSLICSISLFAQNEELLFSPEGIAEIRITLEDGKQIGDIKNEKANADYAGKVKAQMTIKNSSTSVYNSTDLFTSRIWIDGRGNTSWHHDKRPYNIDLVMEDWDTENPAALLGMPEGDEWCLLAFWNDRSLMRFQIASYLGQRMEGISWTPRNRYVEVWINNDYRGLYALTEKIQRSDNRVDIKKLDTTSTDLSGGYILEASPEDGHKSTPIEVATQFKTSRDGINFVFKYPKAKNVTQEQRAWIKNYLDEFETALRSNDSTDPVNGYQKYINENSFIDWTILHELSKGCDNLFHASVFVQKDRNDKLNMSAPWDFDLSFGNSGVYTEDGKWIRSHRWFSLLYQDERYAQKFNARYDELTPLFQTIPQILTTNYIQLEESGALDREYNRFPKILDEFKSDGEGRTTPTTYKGHTRFLSEWTMSRNNWVYISLGLTDTEKGERMKKIRPVIRVMDPEGMELGLAFDVKVMKSDDNNNQYTYSWNDASFNNTSSRRISQKGKYWVKIKDEWGNSSLTSDTLYFGVTPPPPPIPTAMDKIEAGHFFTYNNPVKDFLDIHYSASENSSAVIGLFDIKGSKVISSTYTLQPGENRIQISCSGLTNGIYILHIQLKNETVLKKVIVK
ncbi:MAG: hypothetical protein EZS26_000673 [Candidatus Ordinivivax streblomastigis]|uniref:Secretion system C-terminal sorting domain-containing protein n=1 Tax=Candidatus Ordinivivax streblomastigis TaxID=2540710 RepID=A0A5M8P4A9_9BACT|nr:MAG: hypothetical protein EZS26_000673 [Candidatus Ordinivivax streblomastigis]